MRESSGDFPAPKRTVVLDSWPVMEWLKKRQPFAQQFRELLAIAEKGGIELFLSSINLGEIYYSSWNEWDRARAEEILMDFATLPIQLVHPTEADVLAAARVKAEFKVSYADCFVAVLAAKLRCPVMTGDLHFLMMQGAGLLQVEWVGR